MDKNKWIVGIIFVSCIALIAAYFFRKNENKPLYLLPHYGPKTYNAEKVDTNYHSIPNFGFTNQYNELITQENTKGKIYVADYFFTTCQSICPIMSNQMERVAAKFASNPDILFLSHTVNPEEDSVPVLMNYALQHHAVKNKWHFLTGNKKDLYDIARKGYLLNAEEGDGGEDDFIHTQNFALIDKQRHIRGFYDGTDSVSINKMIIDIEMLLKEENAQK